MTSVQRVYVRNSRLPFEEDETHEFKGHREMAPEDTPAWVFRTPNERQTRQAISRNLNAFLNTGRGGTVYCGVDDGGRVMGFHLTQYQRDHVLLSVRDTLLRYRPAVPSNRSRLTFVPVVSPGEEESPPAEMPYDSRLRSKHHLVATSLYCWCDADARARSAAGQIPLSYVIEVTILPWPGRDTTLHPIYLTESGQCFVRRQASVMQLTAADCIQLTRHEAAALFRRQSEQVALAVQRDVAALNAGRPPAEPPCRCRPPASQRVETSGALAAGPGPGRTRAHASSTDSGLGADSAPDLGAGDGIADSLLAGDGPSQAVFGEKQEKDRGDEEECTKLDAEAGVVGTDKTDSAGAMQGGDESQAGSYASGLEDVSAMLQQLLAKVGDACQETCAPADSRISQTNLTGQVNATTASNDVHDESSTSASFSTSDSLLSDAILPGASDSASLDPGVGNISTSEPSIGGCEASMSLSANEADLSLVEPECPKLEQNRRESDAPLLEAQTASLSLAPDPGVEADISSLSLTPNPGVEADLDVGADISLSQRSLRPAETPELRPGGAEAAACEPAAVASPSSPPVPPGPPVPSVPPSPPGPPPPSLLDAAARPRCLPASAETETGRQAPAKGGEEWEQGWEQETGEEWEQETGEEKEQEWEQEAESDDSLDSWDAGYNRRPALTETGP